MNVQSMILWRKFFSGFAYTAMQSVFFIYLQYYKGFNTQQITCTFSLLVFTSQAFSLFAGSWGDRFGRCRMMMLGSLMDVVAYLLLLLTQSYPLLFVSTFLFGLGSTLFSTNARAFLLANTAEKYGLKTKAQGKFLKVSSFASMVAPLFALPFIYYQQAEWLIWSSAAIEIAMFAFMLFTMPKSQCRFKFEPFRFSQFGQVITKPFIYVHLLLFIPLGFGSAFYLIFPHLLGNQLSQPELVPVAFFINNLIAVLLQSEFSRRINFGTRILSTLMPMLVVLLIFAVAYIQEYTSLWTVFLFLVMFSLSTLFANTAIANYLVHLDTGQNQGILFGMSKLFLAITTAMVMNALPYLVI